LRQFYEALFLEVAFQTFRERHHNSVGDGRANREKWLRVFRIIEGGAPQNGATPY
jgi:hypothetical protein